MSEDETTKPARRPFNRHNIYQSRQLANTVVCMNEGMGELVPELQGQTIFYQSSSDKSGVPIYMWDKQVHGKYESEIRQVEADYKRHIDAIFSAENQFSNIAAEAISLAMWDTPGVFLVNTKKGFTLKNKEISPSPFYINGRKIQSIPSFMNLITAFMVIEAEHSFDYVPEVCIGGETAGMAFATSYSNQSNTPCAFVRKAPKGYGTNNQVEGIVGPGDWAVLFEDLMTKGDTKKPMIEGIQRTGARLEDAFVVFDRQQGGEKVLADYKVKLHAMTWMDMFLEVGIKYNRLESEERSIINEYRDDPKDWAYRKRDALGIPHPEPAAA